VGEQRETAVETANLKYTISGYIYISPNDDCHMIVDAMLATGYSEEFCIAENFTPAFIARLMEAGFLVMSMDIAQENENPYYIVLPKLHVVRSALFFENLHIKRSVRRLIKHYELRADSDFDYIINRCIEKHGSDWLTPPLVDAIRKIRASAPAGDLYPTSFALYRDGKLAAGEFGIICGNVYTSYSGFYEEDNAGTVQIIKTTHYLQEQGFTFFDMGMPLNYKNELGAVDITPEEFIRLFRS